jgi:hypothetical protein
VQAGAADREEIMSIEEIIPVTFLGKTLSGQYKLQMPDGEVVEIPEPTDFSNSMVPLAAAPLVWFAHRGARKKMKECPHKVVVEWQQALGKGPFARQVERDVCLNCGIATETKL